MMSKFWIGMSLAYMCIWGFLCFGIGTQYERDRVRGREQLYRAIEDCQKIGGTWSGCEAIIKLSKGE